MPTVARIGAVVKDCVSDQIRSGASLYQGGDPASLPSYVCVRLHGSASFARTIHYCRRDALSTAGEIDDSLKHHREIIGDDFGGSGGNVVLSVMLRCNTLAD
ncbi:hypothetical protein [Burkholderia pseudomultivorans]|uniref:hypothetical protein n=1 Tax=Burkholderia pseudomultivorans TaxID=1207504 RepID=UPI000A835E5B|nr:hypothetical protein [Burkholderia pseudomultivorans]MBF5011894.1 hypothetical protein [Burkholderia pseudomultivorans]